MVNGFSRTLVLHAGYNSLMVGLAEVACCQTGQMHALNKAGNVFTSETALLQSQQGDLLPAHQQQPFSVSCVTNVMSRCSLILPWNVYWPITTAGTITSMPVIRLSLPRGLRHVRIPDERGGRPGCTCWWRKPCYFRRERTGRCSDFNAGGARISLPPGPVSTAPSRTGRLLPLPAPSAILTVGGRYD